MTLVLMKINELCLPAWPRYIRGLRVYAKFKRLYKSIVMPCQHFASESHRKATERGEKGKERSVVLFHFILFGLAPDLLSSSYVTMGFPVEVSSRK